VRFEKSERRIERTKRSERRTRERARFSCDAAKLGVLAVEEPCAVERRIKDAREGEGRVDGGEEELRTRRGEESARTARGEDKTKEEKTHCEGGVVPERVARVGRLVRPPLEPPRVVLSPPGRLLLGLVLVLVALTRLGTRRSRRRADLPRDEPAQKLRRAVKRREAAGERERGDGAVGRAGCEYEESVRAQLGL